MYSVDSTQMTAQVNEMFTKYGEYLENSVQAEITGEEADQILFSEVVPRMEYSELQKYITQTSEQGAAITTGTALDVVYRIAALERDADMSLAIRSDFMSAGMDEALEEAAMLRDDKAISIARLKGKTPSQTEIV